MPSTKRVGHAEHDLRSLLQPDRPEDLPRIVHCINWYTAMSFNRMLKRTGHFREQRYYSYGFPTSDR